MGPRRGLTGELAKVIRAEGLHLGASSHRIEHNFFLGGGRKIDSDVNDPQYAAFYGPAQAWIDGKQTLLEDWTFLSNDYLDDWLARDAEIVDKYNPDLMYFDWWIGQPDARGYVRRFAIPRMAIASSMAVALNSQVLFPVSPSMNTIPFPASLNRARFNGLIPTPLSPQWTPVTARAIAAILLRIVS